MPKQDSAYSTRSRVVHMSLNALLIACSLAYGAIAPVGRAHAYDLSRAYESGADEVERGFVVGSAGLWMPAFGSFGDLHQTSLEFGAEVGFRIVSIRGDHNIYVVGGLTFSPQQLDPYAVVDERHRATDLFFGFAGARYLPGLLCFGDGLGCPFVELRFGVTFESADDRSGHEGPQGAFTVMPGVGYRFRFGSSFQLGGRFDLSFSQEYSRDLGWVSLNGFAGFGW